MYEDMAKIEQVVVPKPFPDYCSRKVHTAQWIEGEKVSRQLPRDPTASIPIHPDAPHPFNMYTTPQLSQSTAADVQDLVNVGVVAYLTQLLETGRFHADPHPGNLIRTPEGKLCILDFGLQCEVRGPSVGFGFGACGVGVCGRSTRPPRVLLVYLLYLSTSQHSPTKNRSRRTSGTGWWRPSATSCTGTTPRSGRTSRSSTSSRRARTSRPSSPRSPKSSTPRWPVAGPRASTSRTSRRTWRRSLSSTPSASRPTSP